MKKLFFVLILFILFFGFKNSSYSQGMIDSEPQGSYEKRIQFVLQNFINYRFGECRIWVIDPVRQQEIAEQVIAEDEAEADESGPEMSQEQRQFIAEQVGQGKTDPNLICEEMILNELECPSTVVIQEQVQKTLGTGGTKTRIGKIYLITTPTTSDNMVPDSIIAMIVVPQSEMGRDVLDNLKRKSPEYIFTATELNMIREDPNDSETSLYAQLMRDIRQYYAEDITIDARGLGNKNSIYNPFLYGTTKSLVQEDWSRESSKEERDKQNEIIVQKFVRLNDGQPTDMIAKTQELIVSQDLLAWRMYKPIYKEIKRRRRAPQRTPAPGAPGGGANPQTNPGNQPAGGQGSQGTNTTPGTPPQTQTTTPQPSGPVIDNEAIVNNFSPIFGLKLGYGIEQLNFPSFWSERISVQAIHKNWKLGVILPTSLNDYAEAMGSYFENNRKMTHGGVGLTGEIDFPILLIPQSGVFNFAGSYVFGDARKSEYKTHIEDPMNPLFNNPTKDYFVRFDAQLHYTFGVSIDDSYLLRFGLGGTVYNVETWANAKQDEDDRESVYKMWEQETIGGVSGRVEFMTINSSVPIGGHFQYFDGSLGSKIWLQIPINAFDKVDMSLRLEGSGFFPIFKDDLHEWETSSVVYFMPRLIFHF